MSLHIQIESTDFFLDPYVASLLWMTKNAEITVIQWFEWPRNFTNIVMMTKNAGISVIQRYEWLQDFTNTVIARRTLVFDVAIQEKENPTSRREWVYVHFFS